MAGVAFSFFQNQILTDVLNDQQWPKYKGREDDFQKSIAIYLDMIGAFWFHCPNGGSRHALEAIKLKAMGVKAGIPDCMILEPRHGYNGMALELKVGSNKPSEHQYATFDKLIARNWVVIVTWSLEEAITAIDWYFNIKQVK